MREWDRQVERDAAPKRSPEGKARAKARDAARHRARRAAKKNGETGRGNRMNIKTLAYIHRILSSQERVLQKLYEKDVENNAGESAISSSLTKWEEAKEALTDFEGTEW